MANPRENRIYEFEDFRLDAAHLILRRSENETSLTPKAVETLLALVERRGEIVTKDELMTKIWTDAVVEESNLSQYLHILRKTLGNQSDGKPFIETLRRRGYRFNGDVRVSENENGFPPKYVETHGENIFLPDENDESEVRKTNPRARRVERRGNVLALADWTESEEDSEEGESTAPQISTSENSNLKNLNFKSEISNPDISSSKLNYRFAIAAAVAVLILPALIWFVWYKPASNFAVSPPPVTEKKDLTFLRLTNGIAVQDAAISPDGNYFAYSEHDGEAARLVVQQTGQSNRLEIVPPSARKIAGKTFSLDGAFVYFLAQDEPEKPLALYRVPTLGGASAKIADDVHSPVSFSPNGREMIFHRWNQQTGESALIIAASDGGAAERVLSERKGGKEVLLYPAWSPDGESVAFAALHPRGAQTGFYRINKINVQTGETQTLSPENWDACYRIVWLRDGAGLVFIGTKSGEVLSTRRDNIFYLSAATGETRRLTVDGNRYQLDSLGVSGDDSILAVPNSNLSQIWQMSPGGDARTAVQITHGAADGRTGIAPLPDGRVGYIARVGENLNLWLMNHDGTEPKQLLGEPPLIEELRASPDGNYFVFSAKRDGGNRFFRVNADGSNLHQLTFGEGTGADSTVSPGGDQFVYHSDAFDGGFSTHALWKSPVAGGAPVRLGEANCKTPHFSPNGEFLSCIRAGKEILVLRAETGEIVKTFSAVQPAVLNNGAHWTRDGQNLVYKVQRKRVSNLWLQPTNGGAARQLTDFTANGVHNFAYSADGARLYVVRAYQINDAVLIKNFK